MQNLTIVADSKSVTADWSLSFDKLSALVDVVRLSTPPAPATLPANASPNPDRMKSPE